MRILRVYILILLSIIPFAKLNAQGDKEKVCRIEDGKMIVTLNLKWNATQRYNLAKSFDIDSLAVEKAFRGATEVLSGKTKWKVVKINPNKIELSKKLDSNPINQINANDIFIVDDSWLNVSTGLPPVYTRCGVNKFKHNEVFTYQNGIATFFLPSFKSANKVYLSGTFNNWSTLQTPMQKVDSGWIARIMLIPGKYAYKYITDGKWRDDPNNYIRENNLTNGYNSIVYCTNYEFHLKGQLNAKRVILTGSFNDWKTYDYEMVKTPNGWKLPIYLNEGTYAYKFIVDGQWITDPDNKDIRSDASGNLNSFMGIGESYLFNLPGYKTAHKVVLSGSFNSWSTNELVMTKTPNGWQLPYILAPGTYEYKFIVDGKWITDPENPFISTAGGLINSILIFKPNYTFTLSKYLNATVILVSGSFNGWNKDGYRMYKKNGKWELPVYLKPGKYLYKYIVDGKWITDPDNKLWEENEYGTGNSVLWIE